MKTHLQIHGWTAEKAKARRDASLQYAREAKRDGWHASYPVLFAELAIKYHRYYMVLR